MSQEEDDELHAQADGERTCWICFATEAENRRATWLHPCQCRGSTKWVHESCLYRWIDEKQNGNSRMRVSCMQCRVEYLIMFPQVSRMANMLESAQDLIRQCSPFVAVSAFLGSLYWTAVTYGGLTVLQVYGQQRGLELLEKGDPIFLLLGLPFIPVALVLSRLIRWEDAVLRLWHNRRSIVRKLPLINWLFDVSRHDEGAASVVAPVPTDEPTDVARIFCGAILLPSIATLLGNVMYRQLAVPLHRTLLGGITFIGLKGMLKIYLRQRQYLQKTRRHIVDYTEENLRAYADNSQSHLRQYAGHDADDDDNDDDEDEAEQADVDDDMIMAAFATASAVATVIDTTISRISELDAELDRDAELDSDLDVDDVRNHVIITVPDRPFSLFL